MELIGTEDWQPWKIRSYLPIHLFIFQAWIQDFVGEGERGVIFCHWPLCFFPKLDSVLYLSCSFQSSVCFLTLNAKCGSKTLAVEVSKDFLPPSVFIRVSVSFSTSNTYPLEFETKSIDNILVKLENWLYCSLLSLAWNHLLLEPEIWYRMALKNLYCSSELAWKMV